MEVQKIFFSYSRMDSPFALKLAKDLRESGADIWIDQLDIQAGSHWDSAVEKALNSAACVLVIISPFSTSSTNVMDEVSFALETGKKIIPVMLEECPPPFRLRRLQRIDFTKDYNTGLAQLLLSLNLVSSPSKKPKDLVHAYPGNANDTDVDEMDLTAEESEDQMLWDEACRQNTIESYEKYMIKSAAGTFKSEAKLMIKQLELEEKEDELESLLWEKTQSENTLQLYQHYLEEYPDGDYKTLALAAIADLSRHDRVDHKKESTQAKGKAVARKPLSRKVIAMGIGLVAVSLVGLGFATMTSDKEDDTKAWQLASAKKDSISYAAYLLAYPNGKHIREAKLQLDSISIRNAQKQDTIQSTVTAMPATPDTIKQLSPTGSDSIKTLLPDTKPKQTKVTRPATRFVVGQHYQGGIVAYVNSTGMHGLIIADRDLGGYDWDSAKKKCDAYKAGGYFDWRLPTKDELQKMYAARFKTGAYAKGMYWSSTDAGKGMISTVNLLDGSNGKFAKKMTWYVRPVRPF